MYGPVCTVVWQGGVREDSPYADLTADLVNLLVPIDRISGHLVYVETEM